MGTLRFKGELTAKIIRARIGREGYDLIRDMPTSNKAVQKFVTELCSDESERCWPEIVGGSEIAEKLNQQVKLAAQIGILGTYFRGRPFLYHEIPQPRDFGPPPNPSNGRYNEGSSRVLYLARTFETVAAECPVQDSSRRLFIQKFELRIPDARLLKFTSSLEEEYPELHYLLLDSEFLPEEKVFFAKYPYRATHFIAYLCERWGISGVEYPSVRGDFKNNLDAVNLVLFGDAADAACSMVSGYPIECRLG